MDAANPDTHRVAPTSPTTPAPRRSRMNRFLDDLDIRPNDPPYDVNERAYRNSTSGGGLTTSSSIAMGLSTAISRTSLSHLTPFGSSIVSTSDNPEADSFAYIETLLESLAILGKLGSALDIVSQKLPQEIYTLVETTLDEVSERAEYGRRSSLLGSVASGMNGSKMDDVYLLLTSNGTTTLGSGILSVGSMELQHGGLLAPSSLRLAALEASTKRLDQEIMKDLFWTLYSKLDAVAQGLRVVYEVANRIGSVSAFSGHDMFHER